MEQATIKSVMQNAIKKLKSKKIGEESLKARILMEYTLNQNRQYLIANSEQNLSEGQVDKYFKLVKKLEDNIPLEYIINKKEFMKLNFYVDENVLIPRPETEILVEETINIAKQINAKRILDLCTGSGAIVVSLAKYLPDVEFVATDISKEALVIANKNAIENKVDKRINFLQSDLFKNLERQKFDIIVSNPPYIETSVIDELEENVKKEPYIALDGGRDGLDFYKKIYEHGYNYLTHQGYICVEIGYNQKESVKNIIKKQKKYIEIKDIKDLSNNDRVLIVKGGI